MKHGSGETSHRHRRRHYRRLHRLAPDQSRSKGDGHCRQRRRRRCDAEFLCLDQCQLGQSRAVLPAARSRYGRMDAAGERGARHPVAMVRWPVLGPARGRTGSLCRRTFLMGLWHRACRPRRRSTHRAKPDRASRLRPLCRQGRCRRTGRCYASVADRRRTARRAAADGSYRDRACAGQRQDCRRRYIRRADCCRRGGDRGRSRLSCTSGNSRNRNCRSRRHPA